MRIYPTRSSMYVSASQSEWTGKSLRFCLHRSSTYHPQPTGLKPQRAATVWGFLGPCVQYNWVGGMVSPTLKELDRRRTGFEGNKTTTESCENEESTVPSCDGQTTNTNAQHSPTESYIIVFSTLDVKGNTKPRDPSTISSAGPTDCTAMRISPVMKHSQDAP